MSFTNFLLVVVYIRVSTDGQNIAMQLAAAEQFLKDVPEEQRVILVDDGVSALKVKMKDRPRLRELLELIRAGKVGTLVVYDRDRLARSFYEYLEIVRLLHEKHVDVVFTATNVRPFDSSLVIEAIGAMFAQLEGQTIVRRRADAQRQFPSSMLGYKRHKSESGKVTFTPDDKADWILEFFDDVSTAANVEDFVEILIRFKRKLGCGELRLLKMLQTPFYAGCWERDGVLKELEHVKSIVPTELFQRVQNQLTDFRALVTNITATDPDLALVHPQCGLCGKSMKYQRDRLKNESFYSCTSGHRKSAVSAQTLSRMTRKVLESRIQSLNVDAVMDECASWLRENVAKSARQTTALVQELNKVAMLIVTNFGSVDSDRIIHGLVSRQKTLERALIDARVQKEACDILGAQIHLLSQLVSRYLRQELSRSEDISTLAQMLIRRINVYPQRVQFELNFSKFLTYGGEEYDAS